MNLTDLLATAAKSAVVGVTDWAYGKTAAPWSRINKADDTTSRAPLSVMQRAAMASDFNTLFQTVPLAQYVVPDTIVNDVVNVFTSNMFPKGTRLACADEQSGDTLVQVLEQCRFEKKAEAIVKEAATVGWMALRSVYLNDSQSWLLELKEQEFVQVETEEGNAENITAISLLWPVDLNGKAAWRKERWTKELYQAWPATPARNDEIPEFKDDKKAEELNPYGEIPITLVHHEPDAKGYGKTFIDRQAIGFTKALIVLRNKNFSGQCKIEDPTLKVTNASEGASEIAVAWATKNVITVSASDTNSPTTVDALTFANSTEGFKNSIHDYVKGIYNLAGLQPPPMDDQIRTGANVAGVALRALDAKDAKVIESLRDNSYSAVLRHFEKVLRMGKALNLPDYAFVKPEDPLSYKITATFPDFFPPTEQEKTQRIANIEQMPLPALIKAQKLAALEGIEDEDVIAEMVQLIEEKQGLLASVISGGANLGNAIG
jgi:hypothetical protein